MKSLIGKNTFPYITIFIIVLFKNVGVNTIAEAYSLSLKSLFLNKQASLRGRFATLEQKG